VTRVGTEVENPIDIEDGQHFRAALDEHRQLIDRCAHVLAAPFAALVEACAAALDRGGNLLLFGNGGSAADAQHIATELTISLDLR
jgi:D-sedoheptulose 7-phosphate isomerase